MSLWVKFQVSELKDKKGQPIFPESIYYAPIGLISQSVENGKWIEVDVQGIKVRSESLDGRGSFTPELIYSGPGGTGMQGKWDTGKWEDILCISDIEILTERGVADYCDSLSGC